MPAHSFDYAVIRAVPHVERQEFVNVGVILFCRTLRFLDARVTTDFRRLEMLAGNGPIDCFRERIELIPEVCRGTPRAGLMAGWSLADRFHWLTARSSSGIQSSEVHSGLCDDPAAALSRLFRHLVEG
ncbi:MAG TPA: DUF3037 domain-containing protein [Calditrichia bacterium]|nr:DUF3037 domain-containing protein [Calditrichota bacterium]HQU74538.1 DUF3037 domain-containing protein [Calditrichia bacterium]HQV33236.1 DUF3037 domain-containing protein [Calditrichia bacterium]